MSTRTAPKARKARKDKAVPPVIEALPPAEVPDVVAEGPSAAEVAAINEATVARLKAKLAEKKQQMAAEEELIKLSTDGACEILTTKVYRGIRLWVTEPSLKQTRLLRTEVDDVMRQVERLAGSDLTSLSPEQVAELEQSTAGLDERLLKMICPFVCRYDDGTADLRPLTLAEAEDVLGPRSVRELFKLLIGGEGQDPN